MIYDDCHHNVHDVTFPSMLRTTYSKYPLFALLVAEFWQRLKARVQKEAFKRNIVSFQLTKWKHHLTTTANILILFVCLLLTCFYNKCVCHRFPVLKAINPFSGRMYPRGDFRRNRRISWKKWQFPEHRTGCDKQEQKFLSYIRRVRESPIGQKTPPVYWRWLDKMTRPPGELKCCRQARVKEGRGESKREKVGV